MSYCSAIKKMDDPDKRLLHQFYHDKEYGFPILSDNELFGRLILEINQAGLSWETILKKREGIKEAYANFDIKIVSEYKEEDIERLLSDPRIIRNKLKVNAAIYNAKVINSLIKDHGSFYNWIKWHHPRSLPEWIQLFKKHFKFTGGEIVNEFLMSIGVLKGAHDEDCPIFNKVLQMRPLWRENSK